jgi:signal peptidase I
MDDPEAPADHDPQTSRPRQEADPRPAGPNAGGRRESVGDDTGAHESAEVEPEAGAQAAGTDAEGQTPRRKRRSFLRELPFLVGIALVLALLLKLFVVQTFYIPSSSMEDTLRIDDRVLVNKAVYHLRDIERGEVVVFNGADSFDESQGNLDRPGGVATGFAGVARLFGAGSGERDYIKRVIGLPGDRVACCDDQGRLTVNRVPLDERDYLFPGDKPSLETFDIVVPEGRLWVMGDHRTVSQDSRSHLGEPGDGTVPIDKVIGKAFVIVWPFGHWRTLPVPDTFKQSAIDANAGGS